MNFESTIIKYCERIIFHSKTKEIGQFVDDLKIKFPKFSKKIIQSKLEFYLLILRESNKYYKSIWTDEKRVKENILDLKETIIQDYKSIPEDNAKEIAGIIIYWKGLR